jgi:hypothetical protein
MNAPPNPKMRAQTNVVRSTEPRMSIPNRGRITSITSGTVIERVTMIRTLAMSRREIPFNHFIEILLRAYNCALAFWMRHVTELPYIIHKQRP